MFFFSSSQDYDEEDYDEEDDEDQEPEPAAGAREAVTKSKLLQQPTSLVMQTPLDLMMPLWRPRSGPSSSSCGSSNNSGFIRPASSPR
jgi:hypothetical protein